MGTVFFVQFLHLLQSGFHHLVVPGHVLVGACGGIAYQCVVEVLWTAFHPLSLAGAVYVRKVVHLQLLQQLYSLSLVFQNGGHNHHSGVFLRYQPVFELNLEGVLRSVYAV